MKTIKLPCFVLSFVLLLAGTTLAADYVDIGKPGSEAGHNLVSWGPIEPANSGGAYGGIDDCRAIWSSLDTPTPGSVDAFVDMNFAGGSEVVSFKHLDGPADDSFEVWIDSTMMFVYNDSGLPGETWYISGFSVSVSAGIHTVRFEALGPQWSGWGTYGQVCISEVGVGSAVPTENTTWDNVKSLYR